MDHEIKSNLFKYQNQNEKKKWEKTFWVTKRGNKRIKNRGIFRDFKLGQEKYKSGQRDFRSGQRLQIEAKKILNRGTDYKSGQNTSELR